MLFSWQVPSYPPKTRQRQCAISILLWWDNSSAPVELCRIVFPRILVTCAPASFAISTVRSLLKESMTNISSQIFLSELIQRDICFSSLYVRMMAAMELFQFFKFLFLIYLSRISCINSPRFCVFYHYCTCAYHSTFSNFYIRTDECISANPCLIADTDFGT